MRAFNDAFCNGHRITYLNDTSDFVVTRQELNMKEIQYGILIAKDPVFTQEECQFDLSFFNKG